jgi:hypothetical protein
MHLKCSADAPEGAKDATVSEALINKSSLNQSDPSSLELDRYWDLALAVRYLKAAQGAQASLQLVTAAHRSRAAMCNYLTEELRRGIAELAESAELEGCRTRALCSHLCEISHKEKHTCTLAASGCNVAAIAGLLHEVPPSHVPCNYFPF